MKHTLMQRLALAVGMLMLFGSASAETKENRAAHPHQIQIGVGDVIMDIWLHAFGPTQGPGSIKEISSYTTPHLYLQYEYRVNSWLGVGVIADGNFMGDEYKEIDTYVEDPSTVPPVFVQTDVYRAYYESNFLVMPTVNFTYYHSPVFNLYSGLGFGYGFSNIKTESRNMWDHLLAVNATALGMSFGKNHFFGSLEIGVMNSIANWSSEDGRKGWRLGSLGSRLLTLSIGYRF